jgi:hypothetical protein
MFWAVMLFLEERSLARWSPGAKDVAEKRARRPSPPGPPPVTPREPPL